MQETHVLLNKGVSNFHINMNIVALKILNIVRLWIMVYMRRVGDNWLC